MKLAMISSTCLSMIVASALFPTLAQAEIAGLPISADVLIEQKNDIGVDADDPDGAVNTTHLKVEAGVAWEITDGLSLQGAFVLEPVVDVPAGENSVFENHGILAEELKLVASFDAYSITVGKYNPTFGIGWDATPGIWGVEFDEEYELPEQIGLAGSYTVEHGGNEHTMTLNAFFADTTSLSNSIMTRRGETSLADGGAGNTEDLSSFSASFDGTLNGVTYSVSSRLRAAGDADVAADEEVGLVGGLTYEWTTPGNVTRSFVGEIAAFDNYETSDADALYITLGVQSVYENGWNIAASLTSRTMDYADGSSDDDMLYQISTGFELESGMTADFGLRHAKEGGDNVTHVGLMFAYEFSL